MAELVRVSVREQLAADTAVSALGVTIRLLDLPAQYYVTPMDLAPNTRLGTDPYWLWLAPDRALFVSDSSAAPPDADFVSDMTDGLAVFEIAGGRAASIVAMSCTLDPNGPALAPGSCAQTLFGGVKVLLYASDAKFRLHAERQFAAYLLEWFSQAASALL